VSYSTIAIIQGDAWIRMRVSACVAKLGLPKSPEQWAGDNSWKLAARAGWDESWEAGQEARDLSDGSVQFDEIGRDETVITDAMILEAVQEISSGS
jgi:hypothetical protein